MQITDLEMIARVAMAAILGAALGIEREVQHKTAGLRTHTLVASGAALFTVAGASVAVEGTDLTRVAAQVVTGIGFIGAGGMIKSGFTMTGITTAATLWFAAALGVATGFGLYAVAAAALAVALVSIVAFAPIRSYIRRGVVQPLEIEYYAGHGTLTPLFETLNAIGAQVHRVSMVEDEGKRRMSCELVGIGKEAMEGVVASLRSRAEVISVKGPIG
ncbi:MAG: MgtC/SapB family protein [bacterium]|nr:MgtC/SapB family protein [bacterium]MCP4964381.1 MgtC/SapB family protein [bacterium]